MVLLFRLHRNNSLFKCRDLFRFHKRCNSYESDGKTTVSFINRESEGRLMISGFSKLGFRLNSGLFVVGPVVMFPKTLLSWNVANDDDINEDSLSLFCNIDPKPDLLVIGLGDDKSFKNQNDFIKKIMFLRKQKVSFELHRTEKAIAIYNFLCAEMRFVAAALIPPKVVDFSEYDLHNALHINKQWEDKDDYLTGDTVNTMLEKQNAEKIEKLGIKKGTTSAANRNSEK